MSYVGILVLLSLLVLIHEAGHFAVARLVGIPVAEFAVGFGPRVWSRRRGRTEYSLRALPLGGFVLPAVASNAEFRAFGLRRRLLFFLGGPLANLIVTVPLLSVLNSLKGGFSLSNVLIAPLVQIPAACGEMLGALSRLFTDPASLSGVIGIVVQGGQMAETGLLLEVAISLSLSLAVLNLLPVPVLDGGQILLGCLEEAFPRLVHLRPAATLLGVVLLGGLMIYANVQDAARYWG